MEITTKYSLGDTLVHLDGHAMRAMTVDAIIVNDTGVRYVGDCHLFNSVAEENLYASPHDLVTALLRDFHQDDTLGDE